MERWDIIQVKWQEGRANKRKTATRTFVVIEWSKMLSASLITLEDNWKEGGVHLEDKNKGIESDHKEVSDRENPKEGSMKEKPTLERR